jgi:hypothetical protein
MAARMSEKWSDGEGSPAANPTALHPIMKAEVWTPFDDRIA